MTAILVAFALLLGAGAFASRVVLKKQADDGLIVNLAGRQRMLTQKMSKESAQLVNAAHDRNEIAVANMREQLQNTMRVFEMTLFALKDGGLAPINLDMTRMRESPPAATPEIAKQLELVVATWEPFKKNMNDLVHSNGTDSAAASAVMDTNVKLLTEMNKAVDQMQEDSEGKVNVLVVVQSAALAVGLILVAVGAWVTRATIARPLRQLAAAARAMSTGDLNVKLEQGGADEIKELASSFDRMRASMVAALGGGLTARGSDDDL
jgi:methyl-accepting chemotaxis protein